MVGSGTNTPSHLGWCGWCDLHKCGGGTSLADNVSRILISLLWAELIAAEPGRILTGCSAHKADENKLLLWSCCDFTSSLWLK